MRRLTRIALPLVLLTGFAVAGPACHKQTTTQGKRPKAKHGKQAKKVVLPDPLPLPDDPSAATWIAQPQRALDMLAPYSPVALDLGQLAQMAMGEVTEAQLAAEIAAAIDTGAPFANVVLDGGEEVIRLSIDPAAVESVTRALAKLPAEGEFGAVRLPPPGLATDDDRPARAGSSEGGDWLAWIDQDDGGTLVLANSLAGLVTARGLEQAYGERPVFFTVVPGDLPLPAEAVDQIPFARVEGVGDLQQLTIVAQAIEGRDPLAEVPIAPGTLGGLLDAPGITAGVSGRYADHKAAVNSIIKQVNAQVSQLPFLIRGVGENLAAKLNATLRSWDGRVLVAVGPSETLRVAYGSQDVSKSRVAVIRLLQAIVDNVSVARNFTSEVPRLSFRRRVAKGDGNEIDLFLLHDARRFAPPELRPLIDSEGRLQIAMGWSHRVGGGMFVIGPNADTELARWLDDTKESASGDATADELLAGSLAVDPAALRAILQTGDIDVAGVLALAPTGPRWGVRARELDAGRYEIVIEAPKPTRAARQ